MYWKLAAVFQRNRHLKLVLLETSNLCSVCCFMVACLPGSVCCYVFIAVRCMLCVPLCHAVPSFSLPQGRQAARRTYRNSTPAPPHSSSSCLQTLNFEWYIGFKFQSLGKISNISTSDPWLLLGQFQHWDIQCCLCRPMSELTWSTYNSCIWLSFHRGHEA